MAPQQPNSLTAYEIMGVNNNNPQQPRFVCTFWEEVIEFKFVYCTGRSQTPARTTESCASCCSRATWRCYDGGFGGGGVVRSMRGDDGERFFVVVDRGRWRVLCFDPQVLLLHEIIDCVNMSTFEIYSQLSQVATAATIKRAPFVCLTESAQRVRQ